MKTENIIKRFLEERKKGRTNISISLDKDKIEEIKNLANLYNFPVSVIIEMCIELGLADVIKELKEVKNK